MLVQRARASEVWHHLFQLTHLFQTETIKLLLVYLFFDTESKTSPEAAIDQDRKGQAEIVTVVPPREREICWHQINIY